MMPRGYSSLFLAEVFAGCGQTARAEQTGLLIWDNFMNDKVSRSEQQHRETIREKLQETGQKYQIEKLKRL